MTKLLRTAVCATLIASLTACGGGGSSDPGAGDSSSPPPQTSRMAMIVSDASSDDWATVGVKIISIALTPQGGGSPVTVYTAPSTPPMINLEQLDQIARCWATSRCPMAPIRAPS